MKYRLYENGMWKHITEEDNEYGYLKKFEAMSGAKSIITKGFDTSVLMREGCLQKQFFAKKAPGFPQGVYTMLNALFPYFFTGVNSAKPIMDDDRGVGLVVLEEFNDELTMSWDLSGDKLSGFMKSMSVPLQVDNIVLRQIAEKDVLGSDAINPFPKSPHCLGKYYTPSAMIFNRYTALKEAVGVLNKSLKIVSTSFEVQSIVVYAEVSLYTGISTEEFGYGYRVSEYGGVDLVYYMLNSIEL